MNQFNQRFNLLVIVGYHAIVKSFLLFPDFHVGDIGEIENIVQYIYIYIYILLVAYLVILNSITCHYIL